MRPQKSYRELMENVRDSHALFKKAFREMGSWKSNDERTVAKTRKLLDAFKEHFRSLDVRITLLINTLRPGNEHVVDEVLEFLAVDVLAFRAGYDKEKCYRRLKHVDLSPAQVERIKGIALQRCASDEYRREDTELRRLVTKLADLELMEKVAAIPAPDGSRVFEHKRRMFQAILAGRKDLREVLERKAKESNT